MILSVEELARTLQMPTPATGSAVESLLIDFIQEASDSLRQHLNTAYLEQFEGEIVVPGNLSQTLELNTYIQSITSIVDDSDEEVDPTSYALSPFNPTRRNADNTPIFTGVFNKTSTWRSENTLYTVTGVFGVKEDHTPRSIRRALKNLIQFYADSDKLNAFVQSQSGAALNTLFDTRMDIPPFITAILLPWRIQGV